MLEFCIKILVNVSLDKELFIKELNKSVNMLSSDDISSLTYWLQNFIDTKRSLQE